jgi:hypothetical protein
VGLGSGHRRGDRGVEDGAALRDFGGALRHEPPNLGYYCRCTMMTARER